MANKTTKRLTTYQVELIDGAAIESAPIGKNRLERSEYSNYKVINNKSGKPFDKV